MINLSKGQKIDLTKKDGSALANILVGLGWQEADKGTQKKKGILGGLFGGGDDGSRYEIDIDASVLLVDAAGRISGRDGIIYFNHRTHSNGCIAHQGDNLVGGKMGDLEDSEQIKVNLPQVPSDIAKLVFIVNIYDCVNRHQHFSMVRDAYIRIIDQDAGTELARYNLTEDYAGCTSIVVGEAVRTGNGWTFEAIGEGGTDRSISEMASRYGT